MPQPLSLYWNVLKQKMPILLLISLAAAVVAFVIVRQAGPTYEVHFSYLVSLSEREAADEFRFDGFYALQATDLFAATLARWIATPEVIVAAHAEADIPLQSQDPRQLTRQVAAEKSAPQIVQVTVRGDSEQRAEALARGLRAVMERNIEMYHDEGVPAVTFRAVATPPWLGVWQVAVPVIVSATFIFTFLIAVNGLLLIESLRRA